MKNYLVVEFKNAKLFRVNKYGNKNEKDLVIENGKFRSRTVVQAADKENNIPKKVITKYFEEPITKKQINNLLQVLVGDRPKPSLREVHYKNREDLMSVAEDSYLKLDISNVNIDKSGNRHVRTEVTSLRKAHWNSTSKYNNINYETIRRYCKDILGTYDVFYSLMELSKVVLNVDTIENIKKQYTCIELLLKLQKIFVNGVTGDIENEYKNFFTLAKERGLTQFYNYIAKVSDTKAKELITNSNKKKDTRLNVPKSIGYTEIYNGILYIPFSEEDIERVRNSKGCATILDGGFVKIKGIYKDRDLNFDDFKRVGDINSDLKTEILCV